MIHNAASETETASSVFEHQGHQLLSHQGKRRFKCRLGGATCPSFALCTPVYPPNGAGYLRVVLWEEVSPVCRRGDAYDKYSLDCEEAENTVRLRADRHFPLNIQETGINKRRTGRTVSHSWAKNNQAPEKVSVGRWWLEEASGHFSRQWNLNKRRTDDWQLKTREIRKMLCRRCCWCVCALAVLPAYPPPHICSFSLPLSPMLTTIQSKAGHDQNSVPLSGFSK